MPTAGSAIALDALASLLAACAVLLLGTALARRVPFLTRYSIPSPIIGGVLFAVTAAILLRATGTGLSMATGAKSNLLLVFFACLGLTSDLRKLVQGGPRLLRFALALTPFLLAQNALGVAMASLLGLHPFLGLVGGSITLAGGHGTGAAYVARFGEAAGIPGLMGLTMTSATLGLVLGGIIGGPVAQRLISRFKLAARATAGTDGGVITGPGDTPVTTTAIIGSMTAALVAVVVGKSLGAILLDAPVAIPDFLICLLCGLALRNVGGLFGLKLHDGATDLIGSVSLSVFLAWTMMELNLAEVFSFAGPLIVILAVQVVLAAAWAYYVTFRVAGRDYEAAIMSAAFCGFAMGATATAIANMQALANRHGPAPEAFLIVPIIGAFFVDILNAGTLTFFLSLRFMQLS